MAATHASSGDNNSESRERKTTTLDVKLKMATKMEKFQTDKYQQGATI